MPQQPGGGRIVLGWDDRVHRGMRRQLEAGSDGRTRGEGAAKVQRAPDRLTRRGSARRDRARL
jgi:hypothetical protein